MLACELLLNSAVEIMSPFLADVELLPVHLHDLCRLTDTAAISKQDWVARWFLVTKYDYRRCDESIRKLEVSLVKPMNPYKVNILHQILFYSFAIVDIHELTWNQPTG